MGYAGRLDGDLARRESRDELIDQLATTHGLDRRLVQDLLTAAERAAAEDPRRGSAVDWFERLAGISVSPPPAPGRRTRVQAAYGGALPTGGTTWVSPGKVSRTTTLGAQIAAEERRRATTQPHVPSAQVRLSDLLGEDFFNRQVSPPGFDASHLGPGSAEPGVPAGDAARAHPTPPATVRGDAAQESPLEPLDALTRQLIERATGESLGDVWIRRDDPELARKGVLGEAQDNVIRLAPGVGGPEDSFGRRVRLHEAAHILQFRRARGETASLEELSEPELEAEAVAYAAATGRHRPVRTAADPARAHAFPGEGLIDKGKDLVSGGIDILKDPMGFLREKAPEVVSLMGDGLERLLDKIGHGLADAVGALLRGLGLDGVARSFDSLVASLSPGGNGFGVLTGCCECLDRFLDNMMGGLNRMLASPTAQKVQGAVAEAQSNQSDGTIGMLGDFFALLKKFGGPVMSVIDGAGRAIEKVKSIAGPLADKLWKLIAGRLGLDASLSPIEAIKAKLQELWARASSVLAPLKSALGGLWEVIKTATPVGQLVKFFGDLRQLAAALKQLATTKAKDAKTWLATARKLLKGTVFEPLIAALQTGQATFDAVGNAVSGWLRSLFEKLGLLSAWESSVSFLNELAGGIKRIVGAIKGLFQDLAEKLQRMLATLAKAAQDLLAEIRPLLDFVSGLIIALVATGAGQVWALPLFLLGNLWQHVLSDCYKEHLIDFLLDAFIALVEWVPVKGDASLVIPVLRAGALGFLRRMKQVDMQKKIEAANVVASLFAGNLEFAAGLFVGILKGIYESTIGTVVFVFEAAAWLAQAGAWAIGLAESPLSDLAGDEEGDEKSEGGEAGPGAKDEEAEEEEAEEEAEVETADDEVGDDAPQEDVEPEHEGDDIEEGGAEPEQAEEPGSEEAKGGQPGAKEEDTTRLDPPPPLPADLLNGRALLEAIFKTGVSRQEIQEIFRGMGASMQETASAAGAKAADELIAYLTRSGTPYEIGEAVGTVLGIVATEIVIIVLTGGAGAAKTALTGVKLLTKVANTLPKLAKALREIHTALAPVFKFFKSLKKGIGAWASRVATYIDDLLEWAKKSVQKLLGRNRRPDGRGETPNDPRAPHDPNDPRAPRDPKEHDRPDQPRRPRREPDLKIYAMRAARQGWQEIESSLAGAVHSPSTVRSTLARVRVLRPPGVRIQLQVRRNRSAWKVKARAAKGARWATAKAGSGWIAKDEQGGRWYATFSQARLHRDVVDDAIRNLQEVRENDAEQETRSFYEEKKNLAKHEVQAGERRIQERLRNVQFRIEMEPYEQVQHDLMIHTKLVVTPNTVERATEVSADDGRIRAKEHYGKRPFSRRLLQELLGIGKTAAGNRIRTWKSEDILWEISSTRDLETSGDTRTEYTFDKETSKVLPRSDTPANRTIYGFGSTPDKDSATGKKILMKGHRSESPLPAHPESRYRSCRHESKPEYDDFGIDEAILGHAGKPLKPYEGCSGYWNYEGHKHPKSENQAWNRDPDNYWGPEHQDESNASGGKAPRYELPTEERGSHPSWWDLT